jgi:hypothetical protein
MAEFVYETYLPIIDLVTYIFMQYTISAIDITF